MDERALRTLEYARVREMLVERAATSAGKELCEALLPTNELIECKHRQAETSEARRLQRLGKNIPLGGIHDLRPAVGRALRGAMLDPGELLDIADTTAAGRRLKKFLLNEKEDCPILAAQANLMGSFAELEAEIRRAITDHGEIADAASPELANIRKQQRVMQNRIRDRLDALIRGSTQKYLQDALVTIRDDRFVVPVKVEHRAQVPGVVHDTSASGSTLFVEPMAVVELNNSLKELAAAEREEIARILQRLSGLVADQGERLLDTSGALAQVDFASAKGRLSADLDCVEPELNRSGQVEIRRGRHPLLRGSVVPIDIHIGKTFDILVITGPNTGGKTVSLKTLGLFSLMAAAGLHVPAAIGTELAIFEQVCCDVGDEQSIEQSLSTFSSHMSNIVRILDNLGANALVLLDELGAGTDPAEGAALARAVLEHLHARGARTVATTHYSELKAFAYTHPRVENASVEFDVQTLAPTYKLLIGLPGRSNAFEISRRLGLSETLVDRARTFLSKEEERIDTLIASILATRKELEAERETAAQGRAEAQRLRALNEELLARTRQKEQEVIANARAQAAQLLNQVKRQSEEIIRELREKAAAEKEHERLQAIEAARSRLSDVRRQAGALEAESVPRTRGPVPTGLKAGEAVHVFSLEADGNLLATPGPDGMAQVQVGILKVTVPVSDLARRSEAPAVAPAATATRGQKAWGAAHAAARAGTLSVGSTGGAGLARAEVAVGEVDLRGLTVDEALAKTDKYLDDAVLAGIAQVRIIHGKGTGALRAAIKEFLRGHPNVESFRLGGMGEGGDGVTVCKLFE